MQSWQVVCIDNLSAGEQQGGFMALSFSFPLPVVKGNLCNRTLSIARVSLLLHGNTARVFGMKNVQILFY